MAFSVKRSAGELVGPFEYTPSGSLGLSSIDRTFVLGSFIERMLVFHYGREPGVVIRHALRKALVRYYPLAGRLVRSELGDVEVACTGDGIWFVEAMVECCLKDVDWLEQHPLMIPREELIPMCPVSTGIPVMMQVTQFACGGFVVGLVFDHTIADGIGMAQFMNAVAEIARGIEDPTVEPIWCREAISNPTKAPSEPPPVSPSPLPTIPNKYFHIDVSLDHINQLKDRFFVRTGHFCSTFDIITAKAWQCRARAINLDPDVDVRLVFAANVRKFLSHSGGGGGGYYGNCVYPMVVISTSGKIIGASIIEIVDLIADAKRRISIEFSKWLTADFEENPFKPAINHDFFFMVDWTRLGFDEVDYGWGKPAYVAPLLRDTMPFAVSYLVRAPSPKKGVRLITQFVVEKDFAEFQDQIVNAFNMNAPSSLP